jgi:hypothetical protein
LEGIKWSYPNTKKVVTDKQMVDLADKFYGWPFFVYKLGCAFIHLSAMVYYCMVVAQGHSQPFNHTDGCHVFRSDTATDSFQFQLSKGVFQTRAGGFRTVTVMPVCVIEYIAKLDSLVPV